MKDQVRLQAIGNVRLVIETIWPNDVAEIFGSYATGLHLSTGEVDSNIVQLKAQLAHHIKIFGAIGELKAILHANAPILRFREAVIGNAFDASFRTDSSSPATTIIDQYQAIYSATTRSFMGISSYTLTLVCVRALQVAPLTKSMTKHGLGPLLLTFLGIFGKAYDYKQMGFSMAAGSRYLYVNHIPQNTRDIRLVCIDPLDVQGVYSNNDNNTGGAVPTQKFMTVLEELRPSESQNRVRWRAIVMLQEAIKIFWPSVDIEVYGSFLSRAASASKIPEINALANYFEEVAISEPVERVSAGRTSADYAPAGTGHWNQLRHIGSHRSKPSRHGIGQGISSRDPRLAGSVLDPEVLAVKQERGEELNQVRYGGLSSYTLILMCVRFLQVVTSLASVTPSLGPYLLELLQLYGVTFDINKSGFRVVSGNTNVESRLQGFRTTTTNDFIARTHWTRLGRDYPKYTSFETSRVRAQTMQNMRMVIESFWSGIIYELYRSLCTGIHLSSRHLRVQDPSIAFFNARVAILRFNEAATGVSFAISFEIESAHVAIRVIAGFLHEYPHLKDLFLLLKTWLSTLPEDYNVVYSGGISSHILRLMTVRFLQVAPTMKNVMPTLR
ncbi:hypothetical protein BGX23_003739 [Mortierella sp. AD031]|nr:hypothetical protein BGX23_003739 [Mortierella sp. AD031]